MNNQKNGAEAGRNVTGPTGGTRREFLGTVTKSLIGGGILISALATPRVAKAGGCAECDTEYNLCEPDICNAGNTCGTNACDYTDECTDGDTCTKSNTCITQNNCVADTCVTSNSCESDACSGDTCYATTDTCGTDRCSEGNVCTQ